MKRRSFVIALSVIVAIGLVYTGLRFYNQYVIITEGPTASRVVVESNGAIQFSVDARWEWLAQYSGRLSALKYQWTSNNCAGGGFSNPADKVSNWTAPHNTSGSIQECEIKIEVSGRIFPFFDFFNSQGRRYAAERTVKILIEPEINVLVLHEGDNFSGARDRMVTFLNGVPGFTVTSLGTIEYSGIVDGRHFRGIDVVVILNNANNLGGGFPSTGQEALIKFVTIGGGGLVTNGRFWAGGLTAQNTARLLPIVCWSGGRPNPAQVLFGTSHFDRQNHANNKTFYVVETPNQRLMYGLHDPKRIDFIITRDRNTYPANGATVFYMTDTFNDSRYNVPSRFSRNSNGQSPGLLGWDRGNGRVIAFSTLNSVNELRFENYPASTNQIPVTQLEELDSADFAKLFVNAVKWADKQDLNLPIN